MLKLSKLKDRICFPLLAWLSTEQAHALGLTPIDDERVLVSLPYCRGLTLDIGCGANYLIKRYREKRGRGIGVDVYPWPGVDVLCDTTQLPFPDRAFDTVAMLACLNHVSFSTRGAVLQEVRRVLRDDGRLLVTMINPVVGFIVHKLRHRHDPDQLCRGMGHEEHYGLWRSAVEDLLDRNSFALARTAPFVFGLNRLYIAEKAA